MTESRPSGAPRHAEARSSEPAANPLERPLPPGMGRRAAGPVAPERANGHAPARPATPDRDLHRPAPAPERDLHRPAPAPERDLHRASAIPLTAPPAWQVAELQADDEREQADDASAAPQRGFPGWAALLLLLAITGIGGLVDALAGAGIKGTFAIGLIVGSLAAILLVRRSAMFPVVVAPPLVYFVASAVLLYVRSGGLSSKTAIIDAATNWLVYGFPAIAGATAAVLIVAGARMILHR